MFCALWSTEIKCKAPYFAYSLPSHFIKKWEYKHIPVHPRLFFTLKWVSRAENNVKKKKKRKIFLCLSMIITYL